MKNDVMGMNYDLSLLIVGGIVIVLLIINIVLILTKSKSRKIEVNREKETSTDLSNTGKINSEMRTKTKKTPTLGVTYTVPENQHLDTTNKNQNDTIMLGVAPGYKQPGFLYRESNKEEIPLETDSFVIGKEEKVVNYCVSNNPSVSRRHAMVVRRGNNFFINDLGSTNFTFVNESIVSTDEELELQSGDVISLSNEKFIFRKG